MSYTDILPDIGYYIIQFLGDTAMWLVTNPVALIVITLFLFVVIVAQVRRLMEW